MMATHPIDIKHFRQAEERIYPHVLRTPLWREAESGLWLKCENRQVTGSFKIRGAMNKMLGLAIEEQERGIVAASAGNHGIGVAYASKKLNLIARIVVPKNAPRKKMAAILGLGAEVIVADGGYSEAEEMGRQLAISENATWISPYNDPDVICGQATLGLELAAQMEIEAGDDEWEVYVPVSGGGLVCGVGLALRATSPGVKVIGVQAEAAPYMHAFFHRGDMSGVIEYETLADGLAGDVEDGSLTLELLADAIDDMVLVDEKAIAEAVRWSATRAREIIEPAAAVALAGCRARESKGNRVVVLSGGNIDDSLLESLINGEYGSDGE